jgi:hypothetical protein
MTPTPDQLRQQRVNLLSEANDIEAQVQHLRTEANKIEGVLIYLNQKFEESQEESAPEADEEQV